ncbi:MAG: hypothetical protein KAU46_13555 [Candidatus Aminicenantes bacterium]|nr:hypothetical protein [Candidatus Aminicenantes bacterium]
MSFPRRRESRATVIPIPAPRLRGDKLRGHRLRGNPEISGYESFIFLVSRYPACAGTSSAGTSLDSRFRGNDNKEE